MNLPLGCFFLMLWALRRREVACGWHGLSVIFWVLYEWNNVASSTWPFASDKLWEAMVPYFLLLFSSASVVLTLRFCERRYPRWEAGLWLARP